MKETFGLWSVLTVGSSMWISITAGGFECNLNFYRAAAMQPRYCDVCPSVKRVHCDKTKQLSPYINFILYETLFHVVLRERSFCVKFWAKLTPSKQESRIWAFDMFQN